MEKPFDVYPSYKLEFDYVNWKGFKSKRKVEVNQFLYGETEYHPEPQWLLEAWDLEKQDFRVFAMKDMSNVKRIED